MFNLAAQLDSPGLLALKPRIEAPYAGSRLIDSLVDRTT